MAQFILKVAQKGATEVATKIVIFFNIVARYLGHVFKKFVTLTDQKFPIWSHWLQWIPNPIHEMLLHAIYLVKSILFQMGHTNGGVNHKILGQA